MIHDWFIKSKMSIGDREPDQVRHEPREEGELVLLRHAALDNRRDKKLEPHWKGPFRLENTAHHSRTGRLYDLVTGYLVKMKLSVVKERVQLDDFPVFLPWNEEGIGGRRSAVC
jgi:hypothetical protein